MTSIAELVKAAILEAWGCGLSGEDVVAFTILKTGAPAQVIDKVIADMYSMMKD